METTRFDPINDIYYILARRAVRLEIAKLFRRFMAKGWLVMNSSKSTVEEIEEHEKVAPSGKPVAGYWSPKPSGVPEILEEKIVNVFTKFTPPVSNTILNDSTAYYTLPVIAIGRPVIAARSDNRIPARIFGYDTRDLSGVAQERLINGEEEIAELLCFFLEIFDAAKAHFMTPLEFYLHYKIQTLNDIRTRVEASSITKNDIKDAVEMKVFNPFEITERG